jgi:ribonuclease PH
MIPDFDPNTGFLPPSIHDATWEEFEERFGTTLQRKDLIKGLLRAVRDLRSCGCRTIYVDGGFTTKKTAPPKT